MSKVLIIGAGGVGQVVAHKCAQRRDVFTEITLASRTKSKCDAIAAQLHGAIATAQVDADNVPELVALIEAEKPQLVLNVALPYQDLHIMDACLETGVDYLDTANYEPLDTVVDPQAAPAPGACGVCPAPAPCRPRRGPAASA